MKKKSGNTGLYGSFYWGKSLYKGKVHYCLCSCPLTLSLAVEKEESKSFVFQNNLLKIWLTTALAVVNLPPLYIGIHKDSFTAIEMNFSGKTRVVNFSSKTLVREGPIWNWIEIGTFSANLGSEIIPATFGPILSLL